MADETVQAATEGITIPKKRFDEVADRARAAEERSARAEASYQRLIKEREADQARMAAIERRFAPDPDEPEWEDPADKALKQIASLSSRLEARDAEDARREDARKASARIEAALRAAGVKDVDTAREDLAKGYGASRHFGHEWDPDKDAKAFREREEALGKARAEHSDRTRAATASAITGAGSPPVPANDGRKPRPKPTDDDYADTIRQWESDEVARIIEEHRAAG